MSCQNCGKETEGYDMYCEECSKESNDIYQAFEKNYDMKVKKINKSD